jgi:hypothetical protein
MLQLEASSSTDIAVATLCRHVGGSRAIRCEAHIKVSTGCCR